ncbi:G-protein coupled receptor 61-like [Patella vulgata]|uniref:G-protein coupled receptor 61-like n=1 Tax=Patella vulgata TaxID=6465 RepID=UPI0024A9BA1B|nr:G-protein coupled receptor 61-like [Patella vulgata]
MQITIYTEVTRRKLTEVLVLWLGYSSFAINPFLYGCLNRAIRAELKNYIRK